MASDECEVLKKEIYIHWEASIRTSGIIAETAAASNDVASGSTVGKKEKPLEELPVEDHGKATNDSDDSAVAKAEPAAEDTNENVTTASSSSSATMPSSSNPVSLAQRIRDERQKRELKEKNLARGLESGASTDVQAPAANKTDARTVPPPMPLFNFKPLRTSSLQSDRLSTDPQGGNNAFDETAEEELESENPTPKTGINIKFIWPGPEHIFYVADEPESFYKGPKNLKETMQQLDQYRLDNPDHVLNRLVYDSIDVNPKAKRRSQPPVQTSSALQPYYIKEQENDTTLVFESRFESGNLRRAIQVYDFEYDLMLKPDINTSRHTQWFYFSITNIKLGQKYKFNIINMTKPDSLYNMGMKPLVYSTSAARKCKVGWKRLGEDICYYQNHMKRKGGYYYTATFSLEFSSTLHHTEDDTLYLAYCYPYTYTDLQRHLKELEADPKRRNRFRRRALCQTLAGNTCDLLTVTSFGGNPEAMKKRKGVVITARVHPGESNASWMMKGLIDYLTGPSLDAKIVRDNFVFKIIPMLNPDGVIVGNYRCSLAGVDLNRSYLEPSRKLHPTIYSAKQMLKRFQEDREVVLYTDFHGHSRKMNIFMYGCEQAKGGCHAPLSERVFPRMLWKNSSFFSFNDCSFKVQKSKETCGRVRVHKEHQILCAYTLEASFAGPDYGKGKHQHFSTTHFEIMGMQLCDTLLDYCDPDRSKAAATQRDLDALFPGKSGPAAFDDSDDSTGSGSDDEDTRTCDNPISRKKSKSLSKKMSSSGQLISKKKSSSIRISRSLSRKGSSKKK